uniref:Uncharacterized protein n=1 Tax=Anguilla anguilla TaxID=7936 RepID=A0A0E9WKU4_ANGAN
MIQTTSDLIFSYVQVQNKYTFHCKPMLCYGNISRKN